MSDADFADYHRVLDAMDTCWPFKHFEGKSAETIIAERQFARGMKLETLRAFRRTKSASFIFNSAVRHAIKRHLSDIPRPVNVANIRKELDEEFARYQRLTSNEPIYGSHDTEYYSACGHDDYIYEKHKWAIVDSKNACIGLYKVWKYLTGK